MRRGNAVPSDAAQAIASEMGRTLLLAWSGETFSLSAAPVRVRPVVVGLSVAQGGVRLDRSSTHLVKEGPDTVDRTAGDRTLAGIKRGMDQGV